MAVRVSCPLATCALVTATPESLTRNPDPAPWVPLRKSTAAFAFLTISSVAKAGPIVTVVELESAACTFPVNEVAAFSRVTLNVALLSIQNSP